MIYFTNLIAKDTFSYKRLEFDFNTGLHSVQGSNGSSKTSLFLTLQQALFNRNAKGCKVDEVNNLVTGKPYEIEVTFTVGQTTYKVINSRKEGNIKIWRDGHDISLKRIPDNLKLIEEILGCDYQTFSDLIYQSKNSSINLLDSSTNKGRAEFVKNILKLDELDAHLERLNAERKTYEGKAGKIALLERALETTKASLGEVVEFGEPLPFSDLELQIENAMVKLERLAESKTAITVELAEATAKEEQVAKSRKTIAEIAAKRKQLKEITAPDKSEEECAEQSAKIASALSAKQEVRRQLAKELSDMEEANKRRCCPTCKQGVPPGTFDIPIAELKDKYNAADEFIAKCGAGLIKYKTRLDLWSSIRKLTKEIEVLEASCTVAPEDSAAQDVAVLTSALAVVAGEYTTLKAAIETDRKELAKILEHNARVSASVELNRKIEESNKRIEEQIAKQTVELEGYYSKVDRLKVWAGILGPKGYRTAKVAAFLASLNRAMNKYAELICDGRIKCSFFINEEGEIDFTITDGDKSMDIALWSGGETSRIKLVCLFAILELLEAMGTTSFNVLCLDEIFSTLDAQGKEGLFNVLEYLKGKSKAIYTIAHEDLALDLKYDSVIQAVKLDDGTTEISQ